MSKRIQDNVAAAPSASISARSNANEQSTGIQDPREFLLNAPMSRFQSVAVGLTAGLCALDGFDVLSITFAAPAVLVEWGIDKAQLGYALSAGLLAMAMGSLLLAPLADALGRRRMLFIALSLMIGGAFWSAVSGGIDALILSRLVTGLGIGGLIGIVTPLAAEYANARRRDFAVGLTLTAFGAGAITGGGDFGVAAGVFRMAFDLFRGQRTWSYHGFSGVALLA